MKKMTVLSLWLAAAIIAALTTLGIVGCGEDGGQTLYTVTVLSAGVNSSGGGNYAVGATVTVKAGTAPSGERFTNWTTESDGVSFQNANYTTTTFTMPANNVTVTANFDIMPPAAYTVMVGRNPTNGGTVSVNGTSNPSGAVSYNAGTSMTITATASSGYTFNNWTATTGSSLPSGVTATSATLTFTVNGNVNIQANFTKNSSGGGGGSATSFNNPKDGQPYKTTTIGGVTWMAENLNYETESGSWCYDNDPSNCDKYGRLYDWATAMNISSSYNSSYWGGSDNKHQGVCPSGWHLPSRAEWDKLENYVGSAAGTKLKSTSGWYDWDGNNSGNGTDEYGFSALPGGYRNYSDGSFDDAGNYGYWWTATEGYIGAYGRSMDYDNDLLYDDYNYKEYGFSVRCVGD